MEQKIQNVWQEREQRALAYRDWLVNARLLARMTQSQVAQACGISRSTYQKYEYGQRTPKRSKRERLGKLLALEVRSFDWQ